MSSEYALTMRRYAPNQHAFPSRHRAKSRPHTHRNSWRERGGAYPTPLAALRLSLKPIRRSVPARRFFGGQSCNFRDMHLGQNAGLASWALRVAPTSNGAGWDDD